MLTPSRQFTFLVRIVALLIFFFTAITVTTGFSVKSSVPVVTCSSTANNNNHDIKNERRVFVGGLRQVGEEDDKEADVETKLQLDLERRYGPISNVFVLRKTSAKPYAFVDFVHAASAQQAIQAYSSSPGATDVNINNNNNATDANNKDEGGQENFPLYREIKAAKTIVPHKRIKSLQRKTLTQSDFNTKHEIATSSTTLLHVQKSHVHRVMSFLEFHNIKVTGHYVCGGVAIVGVQEEEDGLQSFLQKLEPRIPIFQCAIQKMYNVNPTQMVLEEGEEETAYQKVAQLLKKLKENTTTTTRVRFNTFPSSIAQELISYLEHNYPQLLHLLAPTSCTHILHAVKIPTTLRNSHLWCMGMDQVTTAASDSSQKIENNNLICRAQSKLQEAYARYNYALPDATNGLIAVDCGAAPGGWTQFLAMTVQCKRIYSIDPGELDPIIFNTHHGDERVVQHLQIKVEDAMSEILQLEKECGGNQKSPMVDIWVSDMCLHQMSEQVDLMLQAKEVGIIGEGTFFVLTLKCNMGHSREAFDEQVATQCDRLLSLGNSGGVVRDLQTIHLFSNRGGERTILGYLT
uniref:RRM domain-containing protein n=1 Tax=Ditylum brightwellii TaxID=49249 RepID=A0A7S4QYH7_9STRA